MRSRIGRVVSHPHAIRVTARAGRVTLRGPILAEEVDELLACVSAVQGVTGVENWLEVHERAPADLQCRAVGSVAVRQLDRAAIRESSSGRHRHRCGALAAEPKHP